MTRGVTSSVRAGGAKMAAGKAQRYEAFVSDVLQRDLRSVTSSTRDSPQRSRMERRWDPNGTPMGPQRDLNGTPMGPEWDPMRPQIGT
uniref:Uncharacterized protein n=1 Tax=Meleagris gallopavo TaxID=9103 RepID=A0A803Y2I1_MELGA